MILEYPSKDEWNRIAATFPYKRLQVELNDFQLDDSLITEPRQFYVKIETVNWTMHLQHRISDVWKSYVMLRFYYDMGIPDDEWSVAGEMGGIRYFPHFEKRHHDIKAQFDFYTDVFYHKLFSAWDTLGHLLFLMYQLKLNKKEKPSFALAVNKLKDINNSLYDCLNNIKSNPEFVKARNFRHDITHNFLPNSLGSNVRMPTENIVTGGGCDYTPSAIFKENTVQALYLFIQTLDCIRSQCVSDNSTNNMAE